MNDTQENLEETHFFYDYLKETIDRVEHPFSTLKWIEMLDNDTFKMLKEYMNLFYESDIKNMSMESANKLIDVFSLVEFLCLLENPSYNEKELDKYVQHFIILITLSRENIVYFEGDGKITTGGITIKRILK